MLSPGASLLLCGTLIFGSRVLQEIFREMFTRGLAHQTTAEVSTNYSTKAKPSQYLVNFLEELYSKIQRSTVLHGTVFIDQYREAPG